MLRWIACCPMTIAKGLSRVLPILPNCSTLRCRSLAHMHVLIVLILCLYAEHAGNTFQRLESFTGSPRRVSLTHICRKLTPDSSRRTNTASVESPCAHHRTDLQVMRYFVGVSRSSHDMSLSSEDRPLSVPIRHRVSGLLVGVLIGH